MKLAYSLPDGRVAVFTAAPKETVERAIGPLDEKSYRDFVIRKSIPENATDLIEISDDWKSPVSRSEWGRMRIRDGRIIVTDA